MRPSIPDVVLPTAAVEISKSVAITALDKIAAVPDNAPVSAIPSAAVDISKSLATVVAAGTNVATETGTRAISSLFGRLGGVISMGTSSTTTDDQSNEIPEKIDSASVEDKEASDNRLGAETTKGSLIIEKPIEEVPAIRVDDFYESVLMKKDKLITFGEQNRGKVPFEDYSSSSSLGVDSDTLNLLSRHYRNVIENDYEDEIEWNILQDILLTILNEDASLGISLLLAELLQNGTRNIIVEEFVNDQSTENDKGDCGVPNEKDIEEMEDCDNVQLECELSENDGWENNWSDNDLSDLNSEDDENKGEKKEVNMKQSREVSMGEKLIDDVINHTSMSKSVGVDLALYLVSLKTIISESDRTTVNALLKIPPKNVIAIAQQHVKQKHKNDQELGKSENNCGLFLKTIDIAKLALETKCRSDNTIPNTTQFSND